MAEFKTGVRISRLVLISVVGLVVVGGFFFFRRGAKVQDVCDLDTPSPSVTVCLVPEGDPRASGLEIGTDCYWQTKTIDKRLRNYHAGGPSTFRFEVVNKCTQAVTVELEFDRTGTLGFDNCEGTDASGRVPLGDIAGNGGTEGRRCTTLRYRYEIGARRTDDYKLHAVKVNGSLIPNVTYDPEVVLEKAGEPQG